MPDTATPATTATTAQPAGVAAPAAAAPAGVPVGTPQPTPVAATPAAPAAAPAAAPTTAQEEAAFGPAVTYQPSGDPGLDLALTFLGKNGMSADHPAIQAASNGDFSLLKATLAEKGIPGWEQHVALAEKYYEGYAANQQEQEQAIEAMCVQAAGSEEEWAATLDWASQNAEPAEKEAVNTALAGGGIVAEAVAHFLVQGFRGASGTTYEAQKEAVAPTASTAAAGGMAPLSPKEYGKEVAKLHAKLGGAMEGSRELDALNRRRAAYRG